MLSKRFQLLVTLLIAWLIQCPAQAQVETDTYYSDLYTGTPQINGPSNDVFVPPKSFRAPDPNANGFYVYQSVVDGFAPDGSNIAQPDPRWVESAPCCRSCADGHYVILPDGRSTWQVGCDAQCGMHRGQHCTCLHQDEMTIILDRNGGNHTGTTGTQTPSGLKPARYAIMSNY